METFLYIVFFLSCIVMVGSVLLQPGKTDAGALFTSGVNSSAMNPRGTASVLSKLTIFTATVFMLTALLLSLPALTGNVSVLQTQGEEKPAAISTDGNSNTNSASSSPSNSNAATNSNSSDDEKSSGNSSSDADTEEKKEGSKTDSSKVEDSKAVETKDDESAGSDDKEEDKK